MESKLNKHAKLKKTKLRPKFQKGLSEESKKNIREREHIRRELSKAKDPQSIANLDRKHKSMRNKIKSRIRKEAKLEKKSHN